VLSYANISSAPVLTGNSSGFYHLLGILAIICGVISLILVAILATPSARRSRSFRWIRRDPFQDNWARQQTTFLENVLDAEPDTLADTIVPGIERVPIPPDTGRPIVTTRPLVGVVVGSVPEESRDSGDLVLAEIRQSNAEFLASLDSI
jgi:hypothetical protein